MTAAGIFVALVCVVVYGRTVGFDFVNWDDDQYLVQNVSVTIPGDVPVERHLLTPYLGYPIPLTIATYMVEHSIFGMNPAVFHATNAAIHALAALFLFTALFRLGCGTWISVFASLIFAIHPACVEPVCWVSGRKEVLVALFSILAVSSFLKRVGEDDTTIRSRLPAAVFLVLACLSKPSVVLLPIVFLIADRRGRPVVWGVLMLLSAGIVALTWSFERDMGAVGAIGGPVEIATRMLAGAFRHASIMLNPFGLSPKYIDYASGPDTWTLVLGGGVIVMCIVAITMVAIRRSPAWFGVSFALLSYIPNSGIVPLNREYADSYVYLPMIGIALATGPVVKSMFLRAGRTVSVNVAVAGACILILLAVTSFVHAGIYRDGVALWSHVYREFPDSPQVCRNLGNSYLYSKRMEPDNAMRVYEHCVKTIGKRRFFLKNMAIAAWMDRDFDKAQALFEEYRAVRPGDRTIDKYVETIHDARR